RVFGEAHGRAVFAAGGFPRPHDDGAADFRFFHGTARNGILDRADDNVADAGVAAFGAAEDTEAQHAFGARVDGHVQPRVFLNPSLYRLLKYLDQPPAFELGERPGFHAQHFIADAGFVVFVVGVQLGAALDHAR